jgi:hypothetical protein
MHQVTDVSPSSPGEPGDRRRDGPCARETRTSHRGHQPDQDNRLRPGIGVVHPGAAGAVHMTPPRPKYRDQAMTAHPKIRQGSEVIAPKPERRGFHDKRSSSWPGRRPESRERNEISTQTKAPLSLQVYDDFDAPGYSLTDYVERWITPNGLGEMAVNDTRKFSGGYLSLGAVPFQTASDVDVNDHRKYLAVSSSHAGAPIPTRSSRSWCSATRCAKLPRHPRHRGAVAPGTRAAPVATMARTARPGATANE